MFLHQYKNNPRRFLLGLLLVAVSGFSWAQQKQVDASTWQQIKSLRGIPSKADMTSPSVFVFFDPNCPYCARLWESRLGDKRFGSIPAIWIPVSYLGDSALGKAAFLLRKNNSEELARNFAEFSYETRQGGAHAINPSDQERASLGRSKAVWLKLGGATPLIVYIAKSGETQMVLGLPKDAKLAELESQFAPSRLSTSPPR